MRKLLRSKAVWAGVVLTAGALLLGGSSLARPPDDRELIEQLVQQGKRAIEARAPSQFAACFAEDYRDDAGLSRQDFYQLAARASREATSSQVVIHKSDIKLAPPRATGTFDVDVILRADGQTMPWHMNLEVQFAKARHWPTPWKETWVVESIKGHGLDKSFLTM